MSRHHFTLRNFVPTLAALLLLAPLVQAEPVNINTADAAALAKSLNGIGPAKAKAIVAYRDKNGPFKTVEQLAMVEGISQKVIDRNRADIKLANDGSTAPKAGPNKPAAGPAAQASPTAKPAKPAS
jgi:competence protein ComEA